MMWSLATDNDDRLLVVFFGVPIQHLIVLSMRSFKVKVENGRPSNDAFSRSPHSMALLLDENVLPLTYFLSK